MEASAAPVDPETTGMPHLECVDKIWKIPLVEMAWNQSAGMYGKVKEANGVFNWTLSAAEATVLKAVEHAAPIARKLEQPIHTVDQTLCKGIAIVEEKLPLVKEPPAHVSSLTTSSQCLMDIFKPTPILMEWDRIVSIHS
jgi:hypothetical protein